MDSNDKVLKKAMSTAGFMNVILVFQLILQKLFFPY
jgi:hypothetical protein